jgi:hypothetical protein
MARRQILDDRTTGKGLPESRQHTRQCGGWAVLLAYRAYNSDAQRDPVTARRSAADSKPLPHRIDPPGFCQPLSRLRNLGEPSSTSHAFLHHHNQMQKRVANYLALVELASIRIWLRHNESET